MIAKCNDCDWTRIENPIKLEILSIRHAQSRNHNVTFDRGNGVARLIKLDKIEDDDVPPF